jgi:hypothetical protein
MQESTSPVITTRRRHSAAFKRKLLELIELPSASVATVALEHGVNAERGSQRVRAGLQVRRMWNRSAAPSRPIDRCMPGAGLIAHVMASKYADHWPCTGSHSFLLRQ